MGRLCARPDLPMAARAREILLLESPSDELPVGFRAILLKGGQLQGPVPRDTYRLGSEFAYLDHGDIVRIEPQRRSLATLYRRASHFNSLLVTERCDNYCIMCSQPPKEHDDGWLVDELMAAIPLMSEETREIGITGGEPGLLGERLVALVDRLRHCLPRTAVHVLSNGRAFAECELVQALARVRHPDLMIGIPLYSDVSEVHDYVVQARGAYDETLRGILNLKRYGIRVELRIVVHRETFERLPDLARFIARNLLFVDHVALMGLELMGFARANLEALWIDPLDYQQELVEATRILHRAGLCVSVYNHQLCVLDAELHPFARASISDWKNRYFEECAGCSGRAQCGGFFASSSVRRSRGIHAL
jgi:His-Xaa-Ser system radical SAM maturase HxsC